jgi:membrane-bound serine protease (ClpP class)
MNKKEPTNMLMGRVISSLFVLFLCSILIAIFAHVSVGGSDNKVLVLKISGAITQASDDIIANAISKAENKGFEALVISLDTPGGGLEETQTIIKRIRNTIVPVIGMYLRVEKLGPLVLLF